MVAKRKKMITKRKTYKKRGIFSKLFANKKLSALLFVVLFGTVGAVYIWRSSAAVDERVGIANYGNHGYWVATESGNVLRYGDVGNHGSLKSKKITPSQPITDIASRRDGGGYWLLGGDGGVFAFGSAQYLGRAPKWGGEGYYKSIVSTPSGNGYWVISKLGTAYEFGDAKTTYKVDFSVANYEAVMGTIKGVDTIVDADHTASGKGLYMLDRNGKVWAAGQEAKNNAKAKVDMVADEHASGIAANNTNGYIVVTTKGGVHAYGSEVAHKGGMFGRAFNGKMVGITKIGGAAGHPIGYWLVANDGGVFTFGSAAFRGATPIDITPPPSTPGGGGSSGSSSGSSAADPCKGDIVNNIILLQQCLNNLGASPALRVDGDLGSLTRGACSDILKGFCPHPRTTRYDGDSIAAIEAGARCGVSWYESRMNSATSILYDVIDTYSSFAVHDWLHTHQSYKSLKANKDQMIITKNKMSTAKDQNKCDTFELTYAYFKYLNITAQSNITGVRSDISDHHLRYN